MIRKIIYGLFAVTGLLWLNNNSLFVAKPEDKASIIAHRGVHQTFTTEGLTSSSCTARMIFPPTHSYLENTLPSMEAAIGYGAAAIEIDIQLTGDGQFVVFHDHTLDCRTEVGGKVRDYSLAELQQLDIGYGYTADDGATFPFRGKFIGAMPSLQQAMTTFPRARFFLNLKSNNADDARALLVILEENPDWAARVDGIVTGWRAADVIIPVRPELRAQSRRSFKPCAIRYLLLGWSGYVPETCHTTNFVVPMNYRHLMWGWPHRLSARMEKVGSQVLVIGPYHSGDPGSSGIDTLKQLEQLPVHFDGFFMTDRIEVIGPAIQDHRL